MTLSEVSISRLAYRTLFHALELLEYDLDAFSRDTGISHNFQTNFDEKVSAEQYYRAWNRAAELTEEPLIGLVAGAHSHPTQLGALGFAMMNCATTGEAFHLFFRYQHMDNRSISSEVLELEDDVVVSLQSPIYQPNFVAAWMECMAAGYGRVFHELTNFSYVDKYNYRSVHFVHKQQGPMALYEKILRCPVYFEQQEYRFVFDRQVLYEKVHQADEVLKNDLMSRISRAFRAGEALKQNAELSDIDGSQAFALQVSDHVKLQLSGGVPDADAVAEKFMISASTLKRRLGETGVNYRDLCQNVRYQLAQELLRSQVVSQCEVAFMLGFSSGSSFSRAFRQWSGESPSEFQGRYSS